MTREEAIRRIKSWNLDSDDIEVLSVVIPELHESTDERVRKALISLIYEDSHTYKSFAGIALDSMIAYLEKQKELPTNEEMLNSCISSIEEAKENRYAYKETDGDTSYDHEIAWLKSLRPQPHWKPSEAQMRYLLAVINDPNNIGSESCYMTIKSLYNDLKKL